MSQQAYGEAVEAYTKACDIYPANIVARCNRAQAHLKLKNFEAAETDAQRCLDEMNLAAYKSCNDDTTEVLRYKLVRQCLRHSIIFICMRHLYYIYVN